MAIRNIQLNYLYRDAGNYKAFGNEVFSNPDKLSVKEIERQIRTVLIDEQFFDPSRWGVKRLEIAEWDDELDHDWHEFKSFKITHAEATNSQSISDLIRNISLAKDHCSPLKNYG